MKKIKQHPCLTPNKSAHSKLQKTNVQNKALKLRGENIREYLWDLGRETPYIKLQRTKAVPFIQYIMSHFQQKVTTCTQKHKTKFEEREQMPEPDLDLAEMLEFSG